MNNSTKEKTFVDLSREIADKFIRDIVFIDELAYGKVPENTEVTKVHNNVFDAKAVSNAFLKGGKICAIYAPQNENDIDDCIKAIQKADAVVLDWNMRLSSAQKYDPMADDESDTRGHYSKQLIKSIVDDAGSNKVKLVVVYTGETDLSDITSQIHQHINNNSAELKDECIVQSLANNVRIIVRAKETSLFEHSDQLKSKVVKYTDLPDFIINEFAEITKGLLPNYALSAITAIRDNTSNILGVFSKDIDPAFLGHYVSIPDCNDAISMLSKMFGTAVTNLIDVEDFPIKEWILKWIETKTDRKVTILDEEIEINKDNLKKLVESTNSFRNKVKKSFNIAIEHNEHEKEDTYKMHATELFAENNADALNYKWAKLVQHGNLFSVPRSYRLTTGTIVKCKNDTDDNWRYLICIQQSCDSVRISSNEKRSFLFLPLRPQNANIKGEAIVIGEQEHLIVDNKTYSIELHKFSPKEKEANITAKLKDNNEYVFEDTDGKQFVWVAELKEMFAQHLVSSYASQLSRVGIDNSEWIRIVGKMN